MTRQPANTGRQSEFSQEIAVGYDRPYLVDPQNFGGKAYGLAFLELNRFQVPRWLALSTHAFNLFIHENQLSQVVKEFIENMRNNASIDTLSEQGVHVAKAFKAAKLPALVAEKIEFLCHSSDFYAVRSSAVGEDGEKYSFAGQMDSFLFRQGPEDVHSAIIDCYCALFSPTAISYRMQNNLTELDLSMGVVIQEMVDSEVSGVTFTANPLNGNRQQVLTSANYGQGLGVVNGECDTDQFISNHQGEVIDKQIAEKTDCFRYADRVVQKIAVPPENIHSECLDRQTIKILTLESIRLAQLRGVPQDIEWAFKRGEIYWLQARNITRLPVNRKSPQAIVFDNSNIQESFCGVTTPLTYSFANQAYFLVYHQLLALTGMPEKELKQHEHRHRNMISIIDGRVYYNIKSWYQGLLVLPSFGRNKEDMENMMGVQKPVDFIEDQQMTWTQKLKMLPRLFKTYWKLGTSFRKIDSIVANFEKNFDFHYHQVKREDFQFMAPEELLGQIDYIIENITAQWSAPLINDFYVMTQNGKVRRVLEKHYGKEGDRFLAELLSGEQDLASTLPTKELLKICDQVRQSPKLVEIIKTSSLRGLHNSIKFQYPEIFNAIEQYIQSYGDRCIGELKLESISMRQDPRFLYQCLRNYLKADRTFQDFVQNETQLRKNCEKRIQQNSAIKKSFWKDLNQLRKAIKYRESMRLKRTLVFGLSRDIYLELGKQLCQYGVLEASRDIFFVTFQELDQYRYGRLYIQNLKELVWIRKLAHQRHQKAQPDDHFQTHGLVYLKNRFQAPAPQSPVDLEQELSGIGCYTGVIEGEVALMNTPDEHSDYQGKILCTTRTDPGWAPIFPAVKGLLIEKGSPLSHSAVIAREMMIPTIVGIKKCHQNSQTQ
jgi:pyruvate,water dikinase